MAPNMAPLTLDHLGIPPLAGLCTHEEACRPGFAVDDTVALLKRYAYVTTRLNQLLAAHLAHTPEWEVKCAFSLHLWLDAEHSTWLRKRVTEMREPPHQLDEAPDPRLHTVFEELLRASNTVEVLVGGYRVIRSALVRALHAHLAQANPLIDQPTCRLLRFMLQDEEQMVAWGEQAIGALTQTPEAVQLALAWEQHVAWFLSAAGGISGGITGIVPEPITMPTTLPPAVPRADGSPYVMDAIPQRDQRFGDPLNQSADIDAYFQDASRPWDERVCALLYKRLREMDVPEWMAPILYKTRGQPWDYYADLSRQLWDEARHAMMGEVGLFAKGVPFYRYPIDLKSSLSLNRDYAPLEAHLILWGIEQSLMPGTTGKRWEWEIARAAQDELVARFQDYDWADEVLHAQIGRKWLLPAFGTRGAMVAAWEHLMERWQQSRDALRARSSQEEWWPALLADVRRHQQQSQLMAESSD